MRWVTRSGVHIDRASSAWLIGRFIDPDATFEFVAGPDDVPASTTPFDMRGVELGHQGGNCTFETLLRRYNLDDPLLWWIGEIVHEADLDDEKFEAPEARGLEVLLRGLSMVAEDQVVLDLTGPMFDGLYEYYQRLLMQGREPS